MQAYPPKEALNSSYDSRDLKLQTIIIPREAPSREVYNLVAREARVYHTSIARPAWFPLGYKSIEFGWSFRVETSKYIMGFQATDFHRRQSSGFYSWRRVFSSVNYNNVYGRWITTQYLRQIKENSKLNNGPSPVTWFYFICPATPYGLPSELREVLRFTYF